MSIFRCFAIIQICSQEIWLIDTLEYQFECFFCIVEVFVRQNMIENSDPNSRKLGLKIFPEWCSHFWESVVWCVVRCWAVCCVVRWCLKALRLTRPIGGNWHFFMLFLQLSFTNCTVISFNAAKFSKGLKKYKKTQKCLKKLKRHDHRTGELSFLCWLVQTHPLALKQYRVTSWTGSTHTWVRYWNEHGCLLFALFTEKRQEEKEDTFVEKLATQVIKNLQVKISSIHIRYEDDVSIGETQVPIQL